MRAAWFAAIGLAVLSIAATLAAMFAAAWFSDDRFGGIGTILLVAHVPAFFAMLCWSDTCPWDQGARLDRAGRKELHRERQRIALAKAIADAEHEAGIR